MSIRHYAVIVVGYTFDMIEPYLKEKFAFSEGDNVFEVYDELENLGVDIIQTYFEADTEDCLFGVTVNEADLYAELSIKTDLNVRVAETLKETFGIEPKVFLSTNVI